MKKLYNQFLCSQLILPEHRQGLKNHEQEIKEKEFLLPDFDDQEKARWEQLVQISLKTGFEISIVFLENKRYVRIVGRVIGFDSDLNCLRLRSVDNIQTATIDKIVAVKETETGQL